MKERWVLNVTPSSLGRRSSGNGEERERRRGDIGRGEGGERGVRGVRGGGELGVYSFNASL